MTTKNQNKTLPSNLLEEILSPEEVEWLIKDFKLGVCSLCNHLKTFHIHAEYDYCIVEKADGKPCNCEDEPLVLEEQRND